MYESSPPPHTQLQSARCGVTLRTGRNYHHLLHERVHLAFQLPRLRLGPREPPLGEDNLKIRESRPWSISKLTCVLSPRLLEMRVHILIEFRLDTTISLQIPSTPDSDRRIEPQQRVTGGGRSFFESTDWQGRTASRHQCTPLLPTWRFNEDLGRGDVLNKADKSVGTSSFGCSHCHRSLDDSPPQSIYMLEIVKDFTQCIRLTSLDRLQPETHIKIGFVND